MRILHNPKLTHDMSKNNILGKILSATVDTCWEWVGHDVCLECGKAIFPWEEKLVNLGIWPYHASCYEVLSERRSKEIARKKKLVVDQPMTAAEFNHMMSECKKNTQAVSQPLSRWDTMKRAQVRKSNQLLDITTSAKQRQL